MDSVRDEHLLADDFEETDDDDTDETDDVSISRKQICLGDFLGDFLKLWIEACLLFELSARILY